MNYMSKLKHVLLQNAIAFDQMANTFLSLFSPFAWSGTWADETLSCRANRAYADNKMFGKITMPVIDFLFAWQKIPAGAIGHCHAAYMSEQARYNMPAELRSKD